MATINSMMSSGMFGSSNSSSIFGGSGSFNFSDYASIKNGSYGKLMKAYYKNEGSDSSSKVDRNDKKAVNDLVKSLNRTSDTAGSLSKSISALNKDSLYEKKDITKKDENGKKTTENDYDWDAISKSVKSYVDSYNDTMDDAAESSNTSVLRNAAWMTKITKKNESALAKVGISVGSDNKLKVDEDKLKTADINDIKNVFGGNNSYGAQMNYKAQQIGNAANSAANTYTGSGTYSRMIQSTWGTSI